MGLFGDQIVPAVLYRYTQVLRRPDLVNSKGKPLVTAARLEAVWKEDCWTNLLLWWLTPQ
jgi:hypothetical protein